MNAVPRETLDVVYPLGTGSKCQNMELKYSLRSLEFIKHGNVFVIGQKPFWIKNVNYIRMTDWGRNKQTNVLKKILRMCNNGYLSEDFIYMNDDFFFLKEQEIKTYIRRQSLDQLYKSLNGSNYARAVQTTALYLKTKELPLLNYEVHYPMIINKKKFLEIFRKINFDDGAVVYRSIYGNSLGLEGIPADDFKAYNLIQFNKMKEGEFISTDNRVALYSDFRRFMMKKFFKKSKYEA